MQQHHVFSIAVEDKPMVLVRISSLFTRRGFNIDSLTVANTNQKGISRFTIALRGDGKTLEQIRKQTQKLIHVLTTRELCEENAVIREIAIFKLHHIAKYAKKIHHIIDFYGARVLDMTGDVFIMEVSGATAKIDAMIQELGEDIILESIRSGKIGLSKGQTKT